MNYAIAQLFMDLTRLLRFMKGMQFEKVTNLFSWKMVHLKTWLLLKCSQLFVWVINVCIWVQKKFFKEMQESFCCLCNVKQKGNLRNHKFWIPMFTTSLERHKNNSKFEAPLSSLPNGLHGSSVTQLNPSYIPTQNDGLTTNCCKYW
jgi:hypothetical protein